jgi:hypothetical protein
VLRLAAALSDADVSLRQKVKLRSFKRAERRKLLEMMDGAKNLAEDFATRPEQFKRLLERLRPGDYNFENVKAAQDTLYNKSVKSFSALVDPQEPTEEMLDIVRSVRVSSCAASTTSTACSAQGRVAFVACPAQADHAPACELPRLYRHHQRPLDAHDSAEVQLGSRADRGEQEDQD